MKITLINVSTTHQHQMDVEPNTSVASLLDEVERSLGHQKSLVKFISEGKQLEEGRTLEDYGIKDGYPIYLVVRGGGGISANLVTVAYPGKTDLIDHAYRGRASDVKRIISEGKFDVNYHEPDDGWTALHKAVFSGSIETVDILLDAGADLEAVDMRGETPLMSAIFADKNQVAIHLIEKKANVNVTNNWKMTPLHTSSYRGMNEIVDLLIKNGADTQAKDREGKIPSDYKK